MYSLPVAYVTVPYIAHPIIGLTSNGQSTRYSLEIPGGKQAMSLNRVHEVFKPTYSTLACPEDVLEIPAINQMPQ